MLHKSRDVKWTHRLLNSRDEPILDLDGVTGGSVRLEGLTRLGGYGTIELDDLGQDIDWMRHRVQSIYDPGLPGVEPRPIATMLLSSPTDNYRGTGKGYTVGLLAKTIVIDEDAFPSAYSLPAGANIIASAIAVIQSTGEEQITATPSDATLANPLSWEAGESKLTIVNDLLKAANYWSLWCDGAGQFRVEPYIEPSERAIAYSFVKGETAIHLEDWTRDRDMSSVPNLFVVRGQGSDTAPPMSASWPNNDPDSPYSFQARGRWIVRTEEGVEGSDPEVFLQLAKRRLLDATTAVEHVKVSHELVYLNPNDVVWFQHDDYAARLQVQNMTVGFELESMVSAEWRRTNF